MVCVFLILADGRQLKRASSVAIFKRNRENVFWTIGKLGIKLNCTLRRRRTSARLRDDCQPQIKIMITEKKKWAMAGKYRKSPKIGQ